MKRLIGLALLLVSVSGAAFANVAVPEIDPSVGMNALTLLAGLGLVLRGRRKS